MKPGKNTPKKKRALNILYDIIQVCIGFILCFALYQFLHYTADNVFGSIKFTTKQFMFLVAIIGFTYLPTGVWIGRAIRFGNIYHDLYNVDSETEWLDHKHAVDEYGRERGWLK